jgi:hypothetical protein
MTTFILVMFLLVNLEVRQHFFVYLHGFLVPLCKHIDIVCVGYLSKHSHVLYPSLSVPVET